MKSGEILLTVHPWVAGMRCTGWFKGVDITQRVAGRCWEEAIDSLLNAAGDEAREHGGNAVLNVAIAVDPYRRNSAGEPDPTIQLQGTVANIEPLFADMPVMPRMAVPSWL